MNYGDVQEDPTLEKKRRDLIRAAALALDKAAMIRYNERTGDLNVTGNILYIHYINIFFTFELFC